MMNQLKGKKVLEDYLNRVEALLDADPLRLIREGAPPNDEERDLLTHPSMPDRDRIYSFPGLVERFVQMARSRIPEEIFVLERANTAQAKVVQHLEATLKSAKQLPIRESTAVRRTLADALAAFEAFRAALQSRNTACRGGRAAEYTKRQPSVDAAERKYHTLLDGLFRGLTDLLPALPPSELRRLVEVLRQTTGALRAAYDRELSATEEERTVREGLFLSPHRMPEARQVVVDYLKALLLHLQTVRKRALLYKPPLIDAAAVLARHESALDLLPYFRELETRVKPANPIERARKFLIAVMPVGRLASPYTSAVTSRGKETRMVECNYYNPTNVMILSGQADVARQPGEVSECDRALGEYVFDTLTLHRDWIRDPVGVGKEKGPYYSILKARLEPALAPLLKDTFDLRWHFSADFARFMDHLRGMGEPLPHELDTWFRANLVNPDYEGGPPPAPDAGPRRGLFGVH